MRFRSNDPTSVYLLMNVGVSFLFTVVSVTNLVYQVEVAHLDPLRLLLVGSVLELTCLVFQVPTGLLADAFSRRWAVATGYTLVGAGFLFEGLVPRFTAIALSQVVWGIGITLADGDRRAEIGRERQTGDHRGARGAEGKKRSGDDMFIWAANVMRQVFGPVQRAWLNRSLDPSNRATLFSVDGQADALGQIVGGPIVGVVASAVSIRAALVVSAALLGVALPLFGRAFGQAAPGSREIAAA